MYTYIAQSGFHSQSIFSFEGRPRGSMSRPDEVYLLVYLYLIYLVDVAEKILSTPISTGRRHQHQRRCSHFFHRGPFQLRAGWFAGVLAAEDC